MSDQLVWHGNEARAGEVIAALNEWNLDLSPEDRAAKYQKMAENPFVFYRGSNQLFWMDFAGTADLATFGGHKLRTWIQGDMHVENIGAFGNDKGKVVFDINDFDEAIIADYQYDIWRMATSIVLANMAQGDDAVDQDDIVDAVDAFAKAYLEAVAEFCDQGGEHEVVLDKDNTRGKLDNFLRKVEKKNTREDMLEEWTEQGTFKVQAEPDKLRAVAEPLRSQVIEAVERYAKETLAEPPVGIRPGYFDVRDVAWRLAAGTGGLGVPRLYVLIKGGDDTLETDCILDVKRQSQPTAYHYLDESNQHEYRFFTEGQPGQDAIWHAAAYRAMAKSTDDHLGWLELPDGFYSVRERSFLKDTLEMDKLDSRADWISLAKQWGKLLAAVHSRSLADFDDDTRDQDLRRLLFREQLGSKAFKSRLCEKTKGREGEFGSLVREIALSYARQVDEDYAYFVEALGRS